MRSKVKVYIAALAALLVGMPLAESAQASDGWSIAGAAIDLGIAITEASIRAS